MSRSQSPNRFRDTTVIIIANPSLSTLKGSQMVFGVGCGDLSDRRPSLFLGVVGQEGWSPLQDFEVRRRIRVTGPKAD